MDHATAILEDAGKAIDKSAGQQQPENAAPKPEATTHATETAGDDDSRAKSDNPRKRKGNYPDYSIRQGGGRGRANDDNKRHKKGDMGRADYL